MAKHKPHPRRAQPRLERAVGGRDERKLLLIVCEGESTEPSYFKQFKLTNAKIEVVGKGRGTRKLIEEAKLLKAQEDKDTPYDEVWCVFDKDDYTDFNQAIQAAEKEEFKVAYSNQGFEYWLILHFNNHQGGALHRKDYCKKLNDALKELKMVFDCDRKNISETLFYELDLRQDEAIKRAKTIYHRLSHDNPAGEESSTTVFKLVEELKKYRR